MTKPAPTASLPERVKDIFQSDGVLHESIDRGFVNYRALARWMINTYALGATEDAVLSAIRRLRRNPQADPFRAARTVVARSHLNVRSRTCQVLVAKSEDARSRLPQVFQFVESSRGEMLYLTWGEFGTKILIDEGNLAAVQSLFGSKIRKVARHLSAVTIVEPEEGLDTPGILALLSEVLALQGINVIDAVYGYPDYTFFVREADALRAYRAFENLILTAEARAKRPRPA